MVAETEAVQYILKKSENYYDLILIESHSPILYGLQYKFEAPLIAISSLENLQYLEYLFGNPMHPALYSDFLTGLYPELKFYEKFENLYLILGSYLLNKFVFYPRADELARIYFGKDMPYIEDVIKNTSLLFSNVNPVFSDRRPRVSNIIHYFNIHIRKNDPINEVRRMVIDIKR
ncbi:hypothetical protein HHI36_002730 [Cryptolaemus montrouzieri]|uniref:Uncharacterized protein n=1 Tax=Cryptolaemus montrouzieri TaxID=559131 RepID=A0ABD2PC54_9CUCU